MTKEELVHITLKQLQESFKISPENFRLDDGPGTLNNNIIWQFKVKVEEDRYIQDPLNATKTIIVSYNSIAKQLSCYIYNREVNSVNHAVMADSQTTIQYRDMIPLSFYRTFRQFRDLKQSLMKRRTEKEYLEYMKKLSQIFPMTGVDDLFK